MRNAFSGYQIESIHKSQDPVQAVNEAEAFYVGGGNTFQLLKALYDNQLIDPIRKKVLQVICLTYLTQTSCPTCHLFCDISKCLIY